MVNVPTNLDAWNLIEKKCFSLHFSIFISIDMRQLCKHKLKQENKAKLFIWIFIQVLSVTILSSLSGKFNLKRSQRLFRWRSSVLKFDEESIFNNNRLGLHVMTFPGYHEQIRKSAEEDSSLCAKFDLWVLDLPIIQTSLKQVTLSIF